MAAVIVVDVVVVVVVVVAVVIVVSKCLLLQCKELYTCVKESMDKAANRNSSRVAGQSCTVAHSHTHDRFTALCPGLPW